MTLVEESVIHKAFKPLRDALRAKGTLPVTMLRLAPGAAVDEDIVQSAIDEIIRHHTVRVGMGEPEPACMKLAKMLLTDSAYLPASPAGAHL